MYIMDDIKLGALYMEVGVCKVWFVSEEPIIENDNVIRYKTPLYEKNTTYDLYFMKRMKIKGMKIEY